MIGIISHDPTNPICPRCGKRPMWLTLGTYEECRPEAARQHCTHCGGFLKAAPDRQGFDRILDEYYESRICGRCGRQTSVPVY